MISAQVDPGLPAHDDNQNPQRPSFLASFSKSQISAGIATFLDFAVIFGLVELLHVWYVPATAIGAFVGAVSNFLLNRYWSFEAGHGRFEHQALRYAITSGLSLVLNTAGVYALTDGLKIHYSISVVAVSLIVGLFFNYPMHRHFVFR